MIESSWVSNQTPIWNGKMGMGMNTDHKIIATGIYRDKWLLL